jgi:AcrR family transcriptional regulator
MSAQSRIVDAARRLAVERGGLDVVTVDQIATAAGVAKATVYRHFRGKAALAAHLGLQAVDEDTRTRLLEATASGISTHGLNLLTVERVAADAGVSPATVYWHFGSKEELIVETLRHAVPLGLSEQMANSLDGPPAEVLPRLMRAVVKVFQERADLVPQVMLEAGRQPRLAAIVFERVTMPIWSNVARYMAEQTRRGRFTAGDPMARVFALVGPLMAMLLARRIFGERAPVQPEQAVDEIVSIFLQGVSVE